MDFGTAGRVGCKAIDMMLVKPVKAAIEGVKGAFRGMTVCWRSSPGGGLQGEAYNAGSKAVESLRRSQAQGDAEGGTRGGSATSHDLGVFFVDDAESMAKNSRLQTLLRNNPQVHLDNYKALTAKHEISGGLRS